MRRSGRKHAEQTPRRPEWRRVVVAFVLLIFLLLGSLAALFRDDVTRVSEAGQSVQADNDRSLVMPLAPGMNGTPISVNTVEDDGGRGISVTLLDDRVSGARRFRISPLRYEADSSLSREFAIHRVLRVAGTVNCVTGMVRWLNYEIADDAVSRPVRAAPPLRHVPQGLPVHLDPARTSLICEMPASMP